MPEHLGRLAHPARGDQAEINMFSCNCSFDYQILPMVFPIPLRLGNSL